MSTLQNKGFSNENKSHTGSRYTDIIWVNYSDLTRKGSLVGESSQKKPLILSLGILVICPDIILVDCN